MIVLFTEDFNRADLYPGCVATGDWRGAVGILRAHPEARLICELASARAIDVLRAVLADDELKKIPVTGIAMDDETVATARKMGLTDIQ